MGAKSRGNWNINCCMRFECTNRNKECKNCIQFSYYMKNSEKIIDDVDFWNSIDKKE